jgi:fatty-acyl-CoA synthase
MGAPGVMIDGPRYERTNGRTMDWVARDWVAWQAEVRPADIALRNGDDGRVTTWGELETRVAALAGHLRSELGVIKGDRVALIAYGDPRVFELQFACMRLGAIMVPLNWRLADEELVAVMALSAPKTLLWDHAMQGRVGALSGGLPSPGFGWGDDDANGYDARLPTASPALPRADTDFSEITHILYTSGTTGLPKGALTSQRGMTAQALNAAHTSGVSEPGCHHLNPMPLFHAGGLHALANPILYFGGCVTTLARFLPAQTLKAMGDLGVTHFNCIPTMYAEISDRPEFDATDLSRMRLCVVAGAVAQPQLLATWHARGIAMQAQYGATETGPTVTALMPARDLAAAKRGTAGQRVPDVAIRLVGPDGADVPDGTDGEIWVSGPAITPGYWGADRSEHFTGEWLRTGDVAQRRDGHYYVVGRTKEMYKSGGENVYPAEVERVLALMPGVQDIAVIGVPHPKWGEVGIAVVVAAPGSEISIEELRAFGETAIARYKLPHRLVLLPELPRNVTGKVNRSMLKDQFGSAI